MAARLIHEIRGNATGAVIKHGRELLECDRVSRKLARRSTAGDDLFDRVLRRFGNVERNEWDHRPFRDGDRSEVSLAAPG
jgi:hypothetical protein